MVASTLNHFESRDPFCGEVCKHSIEMGLTPAEIRRNLRTGALEGGWTRKEVMDPTFFDYVHEEGSPNILGD